MGEDIRHVLLSRSGRVQVLSSIGAIQSVDKARALSRYRPVHHGLASEATLYGGAPQAGPARFAPAEALHVSVERLKLGAQRRL
jgi:hypothetical protein